MTTFYWVGNTGGPMRHTDGNNTNINELGTGAGASDWNFLSTNHCWSKATNWVTIANGPTGGWTGDYGTTFLDIASRFPVAGDSARFGGFSGSIGGEAVRSYPMSECLYGGVSGDGLGMWPGGTNEAGASAALFQGKLTELRIDDGYDEYLKGHYSGAGGMRTRFGIDMAREFYTPFKVGEWNGLGIAANYYTSERRNWASLNTSMNQPQQGQSDDHSLTYKTKLYGNVDIDDMYINAGDSIEIRRNSSEESSTCNSAPGVTIDRIYLNRQMNHYQAWGFLEDGGFGTDGATACSVEFNMIGDSQKFSITGIVKDTSKYSFVQHITSRTAIPTVIIAPHTRLAPHNAYFPPSPGLEGVGYYTTRLDCEVENLTIHPTATAQGSGIPYPAGGSGGINVAGSASYVWLGKGRGQNSNGVSYGTVTLAANNEYWDLSGNDYNNDVIIDCSAGYGPDGGTNALGGGTIDTLIINSGWIRPHSGEITDNTHCVIMGGQIGDVGVMQTYGEGADGQNNWTGLEISGQTSAHSTEGPGMLVTSPFANIKMLSGTRISTTAGTADRVTAFGIGISPTKG